MCIHATGEAALTPHPPNTIAVALWAKDQGHLLQIATRLVKAGIDHVLVRECDGEVMAIGIMPTRDRMKVRKVISSLPLIK